MNKPINTPAPGCAAPPDPATILTGMADALLREIAVLLQGFAASGANAVIDLASLPLTPADLSDLEARLGRGEVSATLDVAGISEVWETGYSGAWWVRHLGAGERIASESIVIAAVPEILAAHPDDARAAAQRLLASLEADATDHRSGEGR